MGRLDDNHLDVKEISEMFGFNKDLVRNMCHARGQKFAVRLAPNGKFWINPDKFRDYIERKRV